MEGIAEAKTRELVGKANADLRAMLSRVRNALTGRGDFRSEDIRNISETIGRMAPIVSEAKRQGVAALDDGLKTYGTLLQELQLTLDQTRFMLLARQKHLEATRSHTETLNLWAAAFKQTR